MIQRSDARIWVQMANGTYRLMGAGLTSLRETCKTTLLETPHINSSLCSREILYHTSQLEFEGFRDPQDPVNQFLVNCYLKRGEAAKITMVIGNRNDKQTGQTMRARRVSGYVCTENPGTGEGALGSPLRGKIVFASEPEEGVFFEEFQEFIPY